jgi:hypothetical protein
MKKKIFIGISIIAITSVFILSCSKKSTPTPVPPPVVITEENISFNIDPDPGAATAPANSGTYTFNVNVSSKIPSAGVKVDITTKKDADNFLLDSKTVESSTASIAINTGTLASGTLYNVSVVVTSKSKATNTATKTFKVARK